MFRKVIISSVCISFIACSSNQGNLSQLSESKSTYKISANKLVKVIRDVRSTKTDLISASLDTIKVARDVFKDYAKVHPQCENLINFMLKNEKKVLTLKPDKLESDYHDGDALPEHDDKCHDIKELIVHPATVVSLAKFKNLENSREQMFDEMDEVLSHLDAL